uniref:Uncharacterized protein n=1 Tax=Arundo donax TaxID=35708 RepID=A0A0A8XPC7_ARUDO
MAAWSCQKSSARSRSVFATGSSRAHQRPAPPWRAAARPARAVCGERRKGGRPRSPRRRRPARRRSSAGAAPRNPSRRPAWRRDSSSRR